MEWSLFKSSENYITPKAMGRMVFIIAMLCLFLFIYTAFSKITGHERFEAGLSRVELIGKSAGYVSWLVPIAEIMTAILISIPKTQVWGLRSFAALMTLFSLYIIYEFLAADKLPCHCGGIIESLSWRQHLWFNLGFIALALAGLRINKNLNVNKK